MVNRHFFQSPAQSYSVKKLQEITGGKINNTNILDHVITDIATLETAKKSNIACFHNKKYNNDFANSHAGIIVTDREYDTPEHVLALLICDSPLYAMAQISNLFYATHIQPNISHHAVIADNATIGKNCNIAAGAVIGHHVHIGDNVTIGANSVIHDNVEIGHHTIIAANCVLSYCHIGAYCQIHAGAVIGSRGFGFAEKQGQYLDIPQLGGVTIGDHVEIGANCAIDRGTFQDTVIHHRVRLDNLVHIAHNVEIDQGTIMAGQSGIAGSTKIGKYVQIGGQAGISGHLHVGDLSKIAGKSGVLKNVAAKSELMGFPAIPIRQFLSAQKKLLQLIHHNFLKKKDR